MAGAKMKTRSIVPDDSALAMAKGFGRYAPMEPQPVRKVDVVEDATMKQLKDEWTAYNYGKRTTDIDYLDISSRAKLLKYTAKDVENFSLILSEFQDVRYSSGNPFIDKGTGKAGLFLSALINNSTDGEFVIHTAHLDGSIDLLGYKNTKIIIVQGNAGNDIGKEMTAGTITVNGNAGERVGNRMQGGDIIVKGNAGMLVGSGMYDGIITVEGAAGWKVGGGMKGGVITVTGGVGKAVGDLMKGGEIHLDGDYASVSETIIVNPTTITEFTMPGVIHGKIFRKGVLIVDK